MATSSLESYTGGQITRPCNTCSYNGGPEVDVESKSLSSYDPASVLAWHENQDTDFIAVPVIEVCSISIFKKSFISKQQEECQVYGVIRVKDMKSCKSCVLYDQDIKSEDLDVISFRHNMLTLVDLEGGVISMKEPVIHIDIMDKATGTSIINGEGPLLNATNKEFEKKRFLAVRGKDCTAHIEYIALMFGTAFYLEIIPMKCVDSVSKDDSDSDSDSDNENIKFNGSISAYYKDSYCGRHPMKDNINTQLFKKLPGDSQVATFGYPIDLSRSLVVVPAYSSFVIHLDLRDPATDEPIVRGTVVLDLFHGIKKDVLGQNLKMRVCVSWRKPLLLDEASDDNSPVTLQKVAKFTNNTLHEMPLLEVFSVLINRQNDEELRLYGTIEVYYAMSVWNLFTATEEHPYILLSGCRRLPLKYPSRVLTPTNTYHIHVYLRDVDMRVFIKGYIGSRNGIEKGDKLCVDRRLCTVIKGAYEHGFAAVNYMVMPCSIKAVVRVNFLSSCLPVTRSGLKGKVIAFSSKYEYMTDDEKEYYRCVLCEGSCLMPDGDDGEVKLSRSVLPVPLYYDLKVEVNMKLLSDGKHVFETLEFKPGENDSSSIVEGSSFAIRVSVEWSYERDMVL